PGSPGGVGRVGSPGCAGSMDRTEFPPALSPRCAVPSRVFPEPKADARRYSVVHVGGRSDPDAGTDALAEAVRAGLLAPPKSLPCQFFYDETGSALFEQICRLPEYYLTRTEDAILREHAGAIVDPPRPGRGEAPTLIELGSGSAEKTRRLIAAALTRFGR